MNRPDDLEQLWQTQPVQTDVKGEDMRKIALKKTEKFDRMIRWRNIGEYLGALFVVPVFLYFTRIMPNRLAQLGCLIVVAGALWIVYYLWRHGSGPVDPLPDQSLATYQRALIAKYDHQIRLLRNVKLWYLLPLWFGIMTMIAGLLRESAGNGAVTLLLAAQAVVTTLFCGFVWWLNEVRAVRKIERLRAQVISGTDPGEPTQVI